jgi:hypothetical protein
VAIKGKSKGRTAKAVTRGPKPVYQPVKKPLLAKREFWLVIATILGAAVVVGLVVGFIAERNSSEQDELEQRMQAAVSAYQGELEPILTTVGQPRAPSGFDAFADLGAAVASLEEAETPPQPADPQALTQTAADSVASAKGALEALEAIDETSLIRGKGFSEEFVLYVINSKRNLARAMVLYREAAQLLELTADADGARRQELALRTRGVLNSADEIFARGYAEYVQAQTKAGVFAPPALPAPTGGR